MNFNKVYDVIIVGGGSSGLYAASLLARQAKAFFPSVLILEKSRHCGTKLLMSGGGQCNLTHSGSIKEFLTHYGCAGNSLRSILYTHNNLAVRSHFETLGVKTTQREDGKVFPLSMSAKEVRSALLSSIKKAGFEIKTESAAVRILNVSSARLLDSFSKIQSKSITDHALSKNSGSEDTVYEILTESSATYHCRNLIIACGGCSYPQTGSDGSIFSVLKQLNLEITELSPALVPIHVQDYPYSTLSGISFQKAELRILSKYSPENWSIQNKKRSPKNDFTVLCFLPIIRCQGR